MSLNETCSVNFHEVLFHFHHRFKILLTVITLPTILVLTWQYFFRNVLKKRFVHNKQIEDKKEEIKCDRFGIEN